MNQHIVSFALMAVIFVSIIYRRIRRTIGFQHFARRGVRTRIAVIGVLGALLLAAGIVHPIAYTGDAAGIVAGAVLAVVAIRFLVFERREGELYYRTNVWIESLVLVLFLARLILRFWEVAQTGGRQNPAQTEDPLTAGAIFTFVSYYIVFAIGLLRRERKLEAPAVEG